MALRWTESNSLPQSMHSLSFNTGEYMDPFSAFLPTDPTELNRFAKDLAYSYVEFKGRTKVIRLLLILIKELTRVGSD